MDEQAVCICGSLSVSCPPVFTAAFRRPFRPQLRLRFQKPQVGMIPISMLRS